MTSLYCALSILLSITACSPAPGASIDPAFLPYTVAFQSDRAAVTGSQAGLGNLTIRFSHSGEMAPTNTGECIFAVNTVLIDPGFWAAKTELDRTILIYHEMGHCVLRRYQHRFDTIPYPGSWTPDGGYNTEYVSIMNPYALIYPPYYDSNRADLMKELFMHP